MNQPPRSPAFSSPTVAAAAAREAQRLVEETWRAPAARRRQAAQRALALWPDCAGAYVVLAEAARSPTEARRLYEQGVAAGERALGPEVVARHSGHLYAVAPARPYLHARQGLAETLWVVGERQAAIDQAWALLELTPMDNQGMREVLANWLFVVDDLAGVARLLAQYPQDGSAAWAYTRALYAYRCGPGSPQATRLLRKALQANPHVPAYLVGRQALPKRRAPFITAGAASEAASYTREAQEAWQSSAGALAWLTLVDVGERRRRR